MRAPVRIASLFALAVAACLLASCDPYVVPSAKGEAWVDVHIGTDGGANAAVKVAFDRTGELSRIGHDVAGALFPGVPARVTINPNDGGADFVVVDAQHLYQPGISPSLTLQFESMVRALTRLGLSTVRLSLCPPVVDSTIDAAPSGAKGSDCRRWVFGRPTPADARMTLRPDVAAGWLTLVGMIAAGVAVAIGAFALWRRRPGRPPKRWFPVAAIVFAFCAPIAAPFVWGGTADDLGVGGVLSGRWLRVATTGTVFLILFAWVGAAILVGRLITMPSAKTTPHADPSGVPPDQPLPSR
jgi:hypothetical protein